MVCAVGVRFISVRAKRPYFQSLVARSSSTLLLIARSWGYKQAREGRIPGLYVTLVLRDYVSGVRYLAKSSSIIALSFVPSFPPWVGSVLPLL